MARGLSNYYNGRNVQVLALMVVGALTATGVDPEVAITLFSDHSDDSTEHGVTLDEFCDVLRAMNNAHYAAYPPYSLCCFSVHCA
jgi:hypothetical protein